MSASKILIPLLLLTTYAITIHINGDDYTNSTYNLDLITGDLSDQLTVTVTNDQNYTLYADFDYPSNVQVFLTGSSSTSTAPSSSSSMFVTFKANRDGEYDVNLLLKDENDEVKASTTFHLTATKWAYCEDIIVSEGEVYTITTSSAYEVGFPSISEDSATITIDGDTVVLSEDESHVTDDLKLTVKNLRSGMASVEVCGPEEPEYELQEGEEATNGDYSKFRFLTSAYGKWVEQGTTFNQTFYLRNDTKYVIQLRSIQTQNTLVTPDGEKPIRVEEYSLGELNPNSEIPITVVIDTRGLNPGQYTPKIVVTGLANGNIVSATLSFDIRVTPSTTASGGTDIEVDYPKEVDRGAQATVTVKNIPPSCEPFVLGDTYGSGYRLGTQYIYIFSNITKPVNFTVKVICGNDIYFDHNYRIAIKGLKSLSYLLHPSSPSIGDEVRVTPVDEETGEEVENATITIDGEETSSFEYTCGTHTIRIEAEGYHTLEDTIEVNCGKLHISLSPQSPIEGDQVTITVTDSNNNPVDANVYIDGELLTSNTWTAEAGEHTITAEAEGYEKASKTFSVQEAFRASLLSAFNLNSPVTLHLSKPCNWKVLYNGSEVLSGTGTEISFTPKSYGVYAVKCGDNIVFSRSLQPQEQPGGNSLPPWLPIAIAIMVGLLLAIVVALKSKQSEATDKIISTVKEAEIKEDVKKIVKG